MTPIAASDLTALPTYVDPWSRLAAREDVRVERGLFHLVHDTVTPAQARIDDLLLVAASLDAAGIPALLIRHDRAVPALAIDIDHADAATAALRALGQDEPLYVKARRQQPVLAAEFDAPVLAPAALKVYRPRVSRRGGLRYGAALGVGVEFWRFTDDLVEAPHDNSLTRRVTELADVAPAEVARYGRTWQTVAGMFDLQPEEFAEDVDIVFSWVDASSSDFLRERAARLEEYVVGDGDDSPARYRHVDELRYALRSVHMYAPWVRRIFIATDSDVPAWLLDHPKVTVVRSEEFFPDVSVLPTHNSHAVESQLHRIPGIAEHFLYSNDDMFFGRLVEPELFFTPGGITKFMECEVRIGSGAPATHRSGHDNGLRVNRALLKERFGRTIVRDLHHCATPLRRSVMAELEAEFPEDFARTAASRFRSATDISVTNSLYHHYAAQTGRAVSTRHPRVRYVQTTQAGSLAQLERLTARTDVDMFCLNDGAGGDIPEEIRIRAVQDSLERMFPVRAPWEREDVSAAPAAASSDYRAAH